MRLCQFKGCGDTIPSNKFGCRKHWFSLSAAHQQRVYDAFDAFQSRKINVRQLAELQRAILDEHYAAQASA